MLPQPPQGPYGLVNLWEFMPDVWRGLGYANVWIHVSGDEWIIQEDGGQVVLHRDAGRRGGYACSCIPEGSCRHVRALAAVNL